MITELGIIVVQIAVTVIGKVQSQIRKILPTSTWSDSEFQVLARRVVDKILDQLEKFLKRIESKLDAAMDGSE